MPSEKLGSTPVKEKPQTGNDRGFEVRRDGFYC
jgi:hypothetical protein